MTTILNFDAATVAPSVPFTTLPAGPYQVVMSGATTVATKAKDGHFIKVVYTVIEGEFNGRKIFDNMNCWNKSEEACKIAWAQMSAICHAVGHIQVGNMDELFNLPLTVTVSRVDDPVYGPSNEVKGFDKAMAAGGPGAPPGAGVNAPAAVPAAAAEPAAPATAVALDASAPWNQAPAGSPQAESPGQAAPAVATGPPAAAAVTPAPSDSPPWAAAPTAVDPVVADLVADQAADQATPTAVELVAAEPVAADPAIAPTPAESTEAPPWAK